MLYLIRVAAHLIWATNGLTYVKIPETPVL